STRACTSGFWVSRWRWVAASRRSIAWRFSSSVVGATRVRRRPDASTYMTRSPSTSISSMPGAPNSSWGSPRAEPGDRADHPAGERLDVAEAAPLAGGGAALPLPDRLGGALLDLDLV